MMTQKQSDPLMLTQMRKEAGLTRRQPGTYLPRQYLAKYPATLANPPEKVVRPELAFKQ